MNGKIIFGFCNKRSPYATDIESTIMKQTVTSGKKAQSTYINRAAYILYLVLVLFQVITGEYDWAVANMGIALVFDPFAPLHWQERTTSQKACLLIHLTLLIAGAVFLFLR